MSNELRILRLESILSKMTEERLGVFIYNSLNSTQDHARKLLELEVMPYVVVAQEQLAGRGRQGRIWEASGQGIYFTIVLPCNTNNSGFSLVIARIIHEVCSAHQTLIIKWANDILDGVGKKVSGILVEKVKNSFLIGIGINLSGTDDKIGYLFKSEIDENLYYSIIAEISKKIVEYHFFFEKYGFSYFKAAWLESTFPIGRSIEYRSGNEKLIGKFSGIGDNGELLVEINGEIKIITTAEIDIV